MTRIATLLVDDEPLAIRSLQQVLRADDDIDVVGVCTNGREAVRAVEQHEPQLVFLDIHMPALGGLEVVRDIASHHAPAIVFVTAFDQHAVEAFSVNALDYVLKPFCDERLLASVDRAKKQIRRGDLGDLSSRLLRLVDATTVAPEKHYLQRVLVHEPHRVRVVTTAEIEWIVSAKNYVEIHLARESFSYRQTMETMAASLDPRAFIRVHRSTIVAIDRIRAVVSEGARGKAVILHDGTRLKVSRAHVDRLMESLSTWASTAGPSQAQW
ncbi:MAG: LytTR family DNA-binding domain-containing protein [Deltaproteobacteria bacterium]|nr:LytTR family DNA-binding domain-containing protein [Deltaproteobacteria bacterium]